MWTIAVRGVGTVALGGFAHKNSELDHTKKHFLAQREHWEQVREEARSLRARVAEMRELQGCGVEYHRELQNASRCYLEAVEQQTSTALVRSERYLYGDERGMKVERIGVVTGLGVFASFTGPSRLVSDLRTAYRPIARSIRSPQSRDFLVAAHQRLSDCLLGSSFRDD